MPTPGTSLSRTTILTTSTDLYNSNMSSPEVMNGCGQPLEPDSEQPSMRLAEGGGKPTAEAQTVELKVDIAAR